MPNRYLQPVRGQRVRGVAAALLPLTLGVWMAGCPASPEPGSESGAREEASVASPEIHFPQLKPATGERAFPEALLEGTLRLDGRCLRAEGGDQSYLVLWPPHVRLDRGGGSPRLVDEKSRVNAEVGGTVRLSGGEVEAAAAVLRELSEPLPTDCPGPYWLAGSLIAP